MFRMFPRKLLETSPHVDSESFAVLAGLFLRSEEVCDHIVNVENCRISFQRMWYFCLFVKCEQSACELRMCKF